ncbi:hypothetical protein EJV46_20210 [Roseococcus sp. SYP-B2431]|uniref:carbohydrate-binding domain-containing protein n=1 Tax=Roseococcus sp. SYP-B2431 TaxID=2496640 RepID=UPI00103AFF4F|nr:carbohydrate-binding domain-containing protein [Roseococcus sp. SYP-B2431]TCH96308.1 hypothetical protein EJV46_20210 [Roseococcus sp. SYP-B2431]
MSDLVKLSFDNAGAATLQSGVATLGQVFLPGEIPSGSSLTALTGGTSLHVQMDVKTRYEDGSVKMAVLSVERPALAAGASLEVTLATAAPSQAAAIDLKQALAGHSFDVDLSIHGGGHVAVDVLAALQDALAAGTASFWQQGDLATQARVEIPLEGSQRLVFDVTAFKGGGFAVDAQFNNDGAMGATGGAATYHLKVTMDGKQAFNDTVAQAQYQNWHETFSSNATDGGQGTGSPEAGWLNIRQDVAHLQEAGVVAGYDLSLDIDPNMLSGFAAATQAAGWGDPLATNGVTQYMPGTGGRADIGITTEANTAWLISQDPRAAAYALGQAEAAGSVPWNFWDAKNETWLNTTDYPNLWTDGRGGTGSPGDAASPGLTQQVAGGAGWTTDPAHQPSLSFVPYVLTGERWMLDNLQAQAAWNILGQSPAVRGGADDNVINGNQVRGAAWGLREVDNAAWAAPDGSAEKAYFQEASDANYAWLVSKIPEWTAQQGEAHGWVPGSYGADGALPPWQQDYFASTVIAAASRGNADALTFLEWQSNFLVGRFTQAAQGFDEHDGATYLIAISDPVSGAAPYKTWAEIGAQTEARGWSNGDGWSQSQGDYAQLAAASLAGIHRLTGSSEAKAAYEALIADGAPFVSTSDFSRDPTYAIAGPGAPAGKPAPIPDSPSAPVPKPEPTPVATPDPIPGPAIPAQPGDTVQLSVVLGADSWNGHPIGVVRVDGQEVFRGEIAAQHATGGARYDLGSFAGDVAHTVTVEFLNDAWGGAMAMDRNLYVEAVLADGVDTGFHHALTADGHAAFTLPASGALAPQAPAQETVNAAIPKPSPDGGADSALPGDGAQAIVGAGDALPAAEAGTGAADLLRVTISQDAYQGDAHYLLLIDGVPVGGERAATALHGSGEADVIEILGSFGREDHSLTVRFLNDAWGGSESADRNLYVEAVEFNGVDQHAHAALTQNGDAVFSF